MPDPDSELIKRNNEKMVKIKLCGLMRPEDIEAVNILKPEYIGFVFAPGSKRYIDPEQAAAFKNILDPEIRAVGVFVDARKELVLKLLEDNVIDIAQLHGNEDDEYIDHIKNVSGKPVIKAFRISCSGDIPAVQQSRADYVLLDSGAGTGKVFNWDLIRSIKRPFFLAGGLDHENVRQAVNELKPFAVDVSSGIEVNGIKDIGRMNAFVEAVRT